jgi:hypothetical protein
VAPGTPVGIPEFSALGEQRKYHRETMRRFVLGLVGLLVFLSLGCGGIKGDYGTLAVEMVDAPASVSSFKVHVQRIDVEIGGEWEAVVFPNREIELMDLLFEPEALGLAGLSEGTYTAVRIVIRSATVTDANGTFDVSVPEAVMTDGLEVPVMFEMEAARMTTLLMDFNAAASLKINPDGTYSLDPVIPVVVKHEAGTISGFAAPGTVVEAVYVDGPNYAAGTVVNTGRAQGDGAFRVWALLPGEYRLELTHEDPFSGTSTGTVNGVIVDAGVDTQLGVVG